MNGFNEFCEPVKLFVTGKTSTGGLLVTLRTLPCLSINFNYRKDVCYQPRALRSTSVVPLRDWMANVITFTIEHAICALLRLRGSIRLLDVRNDHWLDGPFLGLGCISSFGGLIPPSALASENLSTARVYHFQGFNHNAATAIGVDVST